MDQFRDKSESRPDTLYPAHADALLRLGSLLGESGDVAAALGAVTEGVHILRVLSEVEPDNFSIQLASALNALSNRQSDAGAAEESAATAAEAVALSRAAMESKPDQARFVLVSSLINLAGKYMRDGDAESCLNQLAEAAEVFKGGGEAGIPFLGPMVEALHRAAMAFAEVGLWGEAVDTRRLMIGLFPDGPPAAMVQLLSLTLQQASLAMAGEGRVDVALQCADESVELARLLFDKDSDEYKLVLAQALGNQGGRRHQAGNTQAALEVVLESVNLFHQVVHADPSAAVPSLILTLGTMSSILTELGMKDQAAVVDEQKANLQKTMELLVDGKG
ncbi:hypothetical protein CU669_12435 [Paramagnetospirillum kuznetsovii]|uniref:Uncharacterized protein n=1 Tax=Paramagnetospirillum kuznetsovii TaxID=2053833 RepID=A0A364NWS5_9PROT|nr:hypothetical protein CU669_12435 [Paramagnetospirillum kuznetsovii]